MLLWMVSVMTNEEMIIQVQALKLKTISMAPYIATALLNLTPVITERLPFITMGVDKYWNLYIHPGIFDQWSQDEMCAALAHEVWHMLRAHAKRAENLGILDNDMIGRRIWNLAGDCEINDDLKAEFSLPKGCIFPETFGFNPDLMAETYYELLQKMTEASMNKKAGGEGNGLAGNDGSGAGGNPGEWEVGQPGNDDMKDMYGNDIEKKTEVDGEMIRQQTAHDIKEKHIGTAPGYAERWADERLHPKVDWRTLLAAKIRGAVMSASGMVDYTYSRPSRRQSCFPNVIIPRLKGPVTDISIGIDTSGSMSQKDLVTALSEVRGILDTVQTKVRVVAGDTRAYTHQSVYRPEEIELIGGGGTDMGAVLVEMAKDTPSIAIVLNDGYTPWPVKKPRGLSKVIICLIKSSNSWAGDRRDSPAWAERVEVDSEK